MSKGGAASGRPRISMPTVRIRLLWHPQAQFAGYHVAEHLRLADGIELVCQPMTPGQGPVEAVLERRVEMAVASPSHLIESGDPGALSLLLAIQQESPLVYPVKRGAGIHILHDLVGRKVGVWPGQEDLEFRWMLIKAGVAVSAVARIPLPDTVQPFVAGAIDCAQMTTYHELHQAEHAFGHDALHLFSAADVGASLLKDGLIARKDWLARNHAVAQAAVDAVLQGWTRAFSDERLALDVCAQVRPDMTRDEHAAQLRDIRALSLRNATLSHGLGYPDPQHAARALQAMRDVEGHAPALGAADIVDNSFWQATPARWRATSWPT